MKGLSMKQPELELRINKFLTRKSREFPELFDER
jgi:hypothetical protein